MNRLSNNAFCCNMPFALALINKAGISNPDASLIYSVYSLFLHGNSYNNEQSIQNELFKLLNYQFTIKDIQLDFKDIQWVDEKSDMTLKEINKVFPVLKSNETIIKLMFIAISQESDRIVNKTQLLFVEDSQIDSSLFVIYLIAIARLYGQVDIIPLLQKQIENFVMNVD